MTEPLRTDPVTVPGAPAAADQASRIEQLLVSGLDLYFAGQFEQAINVWTRVVFLERGHNRARAYIERARSAMAERQRESEELLHRGMAAYESGAVAEARELLMKAVEDGGSADDALLFLQRLNRLEAAASLRSLPTPDPVVPKVASERSQGRRWVMAALVGAVIVGAVALGAAPLVSWVSELRGAAPTAAPAAAPDPLPLVRTSEVILSRARDLYAGGHLLDALGELDRVDAGDPMFGESEQLKGEIQRDLLAVVDSDRASAEPTGPR
jgi:hypothetical protein